MKTDNEEVKEFQLSEETTRAILEEAGAHLPDSDSDGFVLLQVSRGRGKVLLGVDARAKKVPSEELPPLEIVDVENFTIVTARGSCIKHVKFGNETFTYIVPDSECR